MFSVKYKTKSILKKLFKLFYWCLFDIILLLLSLYCFKHSLHGCGVMFGTVCCIVLALLLGRLDELYWHNKSFKK